MLLNIENDVTMKIREMLEQIEVNNLSEYACLSSRTKGRQMPLEKCEIRTEFQRDRDRILHSKSFRRLKDKKLYRQAKMTVFRHSHQRIYKQLSRNRQTRIDRVPNQHSGRNRCNDIRFLQLHLLAHRYLLQIKRNPNADYRDYVD